MNGLPSRNLLETPLQSAPPDNPLRRVTLWWTSTPIEVSTMRLDSSEIRWSLAPASNSEAASSSASSDAGAAASPVPYVYSELCQLPRTCEETSVRDP